MGRPIKQKFFDPKADTPADGSSRILIGGEGVVSTLTFSNLGAGYYSANVAITLAAPQLPGGVQATVSSIALFGNGAINTYSLSGGSGYTSAPAVTITGANATPAVATATLTSVVTNVIATTAFIPVANGGSSGVVGDIVKQVGARRYKVTTAQGTGKCKLVTTTLTAGTMTIGATDSLGSTYFVKKLEERLVTLIQDTDGGSGFDYTDGKKAKWSLTGSAVAPTTGDIGTVIVSSN
jgi:hypothetical protein